MGILSRMNETVKKGIRSWLDIVPAAPRDIVIRETLDYEGNAIKNRIWYRGDSNEIQQLYEAIAKKNPADQYKFWACQSSPGLEIRKVHTGLPALMVDVMAGVVLSDLKIEIKSAADEAIWKEIDKKNKIKKRLEKAVKETLYIGDGAFKVTFDTALSKYPIIEFYPGDRIELVQERGILKEIVFKSVYVEERKEYVLHEHYGRGYITYELYYRNNLIPLDSLEKTKGLENVAFGNHEDPDALYMMAVPIQFYESGKWDGRGQSVFDKKVDAFDSFDETWSQWMDAQRKGRAKEWIPESMIPHDPDSGAMLLKPNPFDCSFIKTKGGFAEKEETVEVTQPNIPHDSYLAAYSTALDLCIQGFMSPSTLGIDVKKLDNSEAQREKEKATLYTRNTIIEALQKDIPALIDIVIKAYNQFYGHTVADVEVTVDFGDYANPSFESQVETVAKAKQGGIMSIKASVDELYGDDKDDEWKDEEVQRLKEEQGIATLEEPAVNMEGLNIEGGDSDAGQGSKSNISNEPGGVPALGGSGKTAN